MACASGQWLWRCSSQPTFGLRAPSLTAGQAVHQTPAKAGFVEEYGRLCARGIALVLASKVVIRLQPALRRRAAAAFLQRPAGRVSSRCILRAIAEETSEVGASETASADDEAEQIFREAYRTEVERADLIRSQLEAALREKLQDEEADASADGSLKISVEVPPPAGPGSPDGCASWREAYQAAKTQAEQLEEQLKKAKGVANPPPPPPPAFTMQEPPAKAAEAPASKRSSGSSSEEDVFSAGPFGILDASRQDPATFQKLEDLAENTIDDEAALRLIAVPVLGRRRAEGGKAKLPALGRIKASFDTDAFKIAESVDFERVYVLKTTLAPGVSAADALGRARQRLEDDGLAADVELFLQRSKQEGQVLLLVMLKEDLPKDELAWWQWGLCAVLLVLTLLSVNVTTFSVSTLTTAQLKGMDVAALYRVASKTIPTAAAAFGTVAVQEVARRIAASKYGVKLTPPFFVPVWPFPSLGTLGAVSRRLSVAPTEESVLALSVAASFAGYVFSIGVFLIGLSMGPDPDQVVNLNFQVLPLLLKLALKPLSGPNALTDQPDPFQDPLILAVPANPVTIGGIIGIVITSLNLLPVGRLDGGAIAKSAFGNTAAFPYARLFGWVSLAVLTLGTMGPGTVSKDAGMLYLMFGFFAAAFQNGSEVPPKDAVTEPPDAQKALGFLLIAAGVLLTVPGAFFPNV